ncbi:MAG: hypothetical protein ACXW4B_06080 [Micavibrio sp.]
MKNKFAITAALSTALFASTASAEVVTLTACTKDGQTATLSVDARGTIGGAPLKIVLGDVFKSAIQSVNAVDVPGKKGYVAFKGKFMQALFGQETSQDAGYDFLAPPTVGGPACQP